MFGELVDGAVKAIIRVNPDMDSSERDDALCWLRGLVAQGADLSRENRKELHAAAKAWRTAQMWRSEEILAIIASSKTPSAERSAAYTAECEAARMEERMVWRDSDVEIPRAHTPADGTVGRMRSLGHERRLARARSRRPAEVIRQTERAFIRAQSDW